MLGCDLIVATSADALSKMRAGLTRAVVNTGQAITGDFVRNPDYPFPLAAMQRQVRDAVGDDAATFVDSARLATLLMGHSIAANIFMLGFAWQQGLVPVSAEAIMRAIELNGVAAADNRDAFLWGRRAAFDPEGVERIAAAAEPTMPTHRLSESLEETIERRRAWLVAYQDEAYARRYTDLVARVQHAEHESLPGSTQLTEAVARGWFRLLARKDPYEVARLFTDAEFERALHATFEGDFSLNFHLGYPQWGRVDPHTGETKKRRYGPWMMRVFRVLARLKRLRDTPFDPFGRSAERRLERALMARYETTVDTLLAGLGADTLALAVQVARLPESIRGYGPIRQRAAEAAGRQEEQLLASMRERIAGRASQGVPVELV